jgi:hypothetical protein
MRRRDFLAVLGASASWPLTTVAQQPVLPAHWPALRNTRTGPERHSSKLIRARLCRRQDRPDRATLDRRPAGTTARACARARRAPCRRDCFGSRVGDSGRATGNGDYSPRHGACRRPNRVRAHRKPCPSGRQPARHRTRPSLLQKASRSCASWCPRSGVCCYSWSRRMPAHR